VRDTPEQGKSHEPRRMTHDAELRMWERTEVTVSMMMERVSGLLEFMSAVRRKNTGMSTLTETPALYR
jgi:hypothetical protein